ncbi:MAG: hypothetical protein A3F18_06940 [Legionellales bacterium RIFCSPHIGHO2_12_FULL_37_14]|nr:MAG: hypothetical protein A3F18_06940 [Legionellales bacterium RIFCSPHIGHO2_12_FULL_37_14]
MKLIYLYFILSLPLLMGAATKDFNKISCIKGNTKDCVNFSCALPIEPGCRERCLQLAIMKCNAVSKQKAMN